MKLEEKKKIIFTEEQKAASNYSYDYTVPILLGKGPRLEIGTGILIKFGDHHLVATAAHNICDHSINEIFIHYSSSFKSECIPITNKHHTSGKSNDFIDVGILEIGILQGIELEKKFLDCERLGIKSKLHKDDLVYITGFPAEFVNKNIAKKGILIGNAITVWCEPIEKNSKEKGSHLELIYEKEARHFETGKEIVNPSPAGFSGSGIWTVDPNPKSSLLWHPYNATLLGIQNRFNKTTGRLYGTHIKNWYSFLKKHTILSKKNLNHRPPRF